MGGRGFGTGRKLGSGDLQLLILKLLDEKSRYGYEIIKELEERSKGFYVPSPGMVYPALTYLEEIGHATVAADGARKLYSITESGKAHLAKNLAAADALVRAIRPRGRADGSRAPGTRRGRERDEEADHERRGSRELHRARRDLKLALARQMARLARGTAAHRGDTRSGGRGNRRQVSTCCGVVPSGASSTRTTSGSTRTAGKFVCTRRARNRHW